MSMASVAEFVENIRALYAEDPDPAAVWPKARAAMTALLGDPELIESARDWPVCSHENLLFYEDGDHGFVLNGLIKAPGQTTRIHDHAHIWVLYGVLSGGEDIVNYDRTDDGAVEDLAIVEEAERRNVGPGAMDIVKPWSIHAEEAGAEGSVAVILRSEKPGGFLQGRYDSDTGKYWRGRGVAQIPHPLV
jgi:predicted metal-dependent enzyme (double-stranded beta helix superfamily)